MPRFEYEQVPTTDSSGAEGSRPKSRGCTVITAALLVGLLALAVVASSLVHVESDMLRSGAAVARGVRYIMHVSDTHVDPLFDPRASMQGKVCHSCALSTKANGQNAVCPRDILYSNASNEEMLRDLGYAFGRYGCNPPYLLWESLLQYLASLDPDPPLIVFTGDLAPHGYPDDLVDLNAAPAPGERCDAKFNVTRRMVQDLVRAFPHSRWAFALGNNDHFPKDSYWQAYTHRLADMMLEEGFLTSGQHDQMRRYGSSYIDVGGVRYLSLDLTIFTIHNATTSALLDGEGYSGGPAERLSQLRAAVISWLGRSLAEAREKGLAVWLLGHQPLGTKEGKDEYDVGGGDFTALLSALQAGADVIRVGLFGHINEAGLSDVLSRDYLPLFPSITAPGVSPRSMNQPSFFILEQSVADGSVTDFEQHVFDLLDENRRARARPHRHLGAWRPQTGRLRSWGSLSGNKPFTAESVGDFLDLALTDQEVFFALETWKRAGYIGDETPEYFECKVKFNRVDEMMLCLFPHQDPACWMPAKWMS